jgi:hypothetical protein
VNLHPCLRGFVLLAVLARFAGASGPSAEHRTYSNVEYNKEGGDLLGSELELTIKEGRVDGSLKIYQGPCAEPVLVAASLSGERLCLSGRSDLYGDVDILGTVRDGRFSGTLRLEKAHSSEKVRLNRIAKPHC